MAAALQTLWLRRLVALFALDLGLAAAAQGADAPAQEAMLVIHPAELSSYPIPRNLTGKFCEHLGANIYNGMDAQVLRNPTFADYPFATGQTTPDGVATFQSGREQIEGELRRQALRCGCPEDELEGLFNGRRDGLACFWSRAGQPQSVQVSPDTGPQGGRAQRIEFKSPGGAIKQWTWLPLHRIRQYEFDLLARSPDLTALKLSLTPQGKPASRAQTTLAGLSTDWRELTGTMALGEEARPDAPCCLVLSSESAGQLVIGHLFLRPGRPTHSKRRQPSNPPAPKLRRATAP